MLKKFRNLGGNINSIEGSIGFPQTSKMWYEDETSKNISCDEHCHEIPPRLHF